MLRFFEFSTFGIACGRIPFLTVVFATRTCLVVYDQNIIYL